MFVDSSRTSLSRYLTFPLHLSDGDFSGLLLLRLLGSGGTHGVALHWNMAKPVGESYVNCQFSVPCGPHLGHETHMHLFAPTLSGRQADLRASVHKVHQTASCALYFSGGNRHWSPYLSFSLPIVCEVGLGTTATPKNCFLIPKSPPWFGWGV